MMLLQDICEQASMIVKLIDETDIVEPTQIRELLSVPLAEACKAYAAKSGLTSSADALLRQRDCIVMTTKVALKIPDLTLPLRTACVGLCNIAKDAIIGFGQNLISPLALDFSPPELPEFDDIDEFELDDHQHQLIADYTNTQELAARTLYSMLADSVAPSAGSSTPSTAAQPLGGTAPSSSTAGATAATGCAAAAQQRIKNKNKNKRRR